MPKKRIPGYRLHKPSGRAVVTLNGKDFYLGQYNSKASWEEYQHLIGEYIANDCKLPPTRSRNEITVEELAVQFLEWAEGYYVSEGKTTSSFEICKLAMGPLVRHYGENSVSEFGPLSLVFLRDKWIEAGTKRETINKYCSTVKQCLKWGVARELVPPDVLHAVQAVDNLKAGRTTAEEYEKVETVPDDIVDKTLPFMQPVVRDIGLHPKRCKPDTRIVCTGCRSFLIDSLFPNFGRKSNLIIFARVGDGLTKRYLIDAGTKCTPVIFVRGCLWGAISPPHDFQSFLMESPVRRNRIERGCQNATPFEPPTNCRRLSPQHFVGT